MLAKWSKRLEGDVAEKVSLAVLLITFFFMGLLTTRESLASTFTLALFSLIPLWTFVRAARIQFGNPGFLLKQNLVIACVAVVTSFVVHIPWALLFHIMTSVVLRNAIPFLIVAVNTPVLLIFGARGLAGGIVCGILRGFSPLLFGWRDAPAYAPWMGFAVAVVGVVTASSVYRVDQLTLAMLTMSIAAALSSGGQVDAAPGIAFASMLICCAVTWMDILWIRRRRQLPPTLRGCKFVKLAYLRKLAKEGGIKRCQDLPPDAFGDPSKATVLLVISHRWMDRYTCDIFSDEYPEGLRLRTMLDKLDLFFSTAGIGAGQGFREKFKRFYWSMTSGSDVLLFFDFMSLPQVGLRHGMVCDRSDEELQVFKQCLPSMGVLYSMCPVLVCEEVEPGMTSYNESGWCFSESCTAWLGGQLDEFSGACSVMQWLAAKATDSGHDLLALVPVLEEGLCGKSFLHESDRVVVRDIIRGFTAKRRLLEAIEAKSLSDLEAILEELHEGNRLALLDQPVDSKLNTPLHLAVAEGFAEGVQMLLEFGADKSLRNLAGDTPVQWFLWPRNSKAARLCRYFAPSESSLPAVRDQESVQPRWSLSDAGWVFDGKTLVDDDPEAPHSIISTFADTISNRSFAGKTTNCTFAFAAAETATTTTTTPDSNSNVTVNSSSNNNNNQNNHRDTLPVAAVADAKWSFVSKADDVDVVVVVDIDDTEAEWSCCSQVATDGSESGLVPEDLDHRSEFIAEPVRVIVSLDDDDAN